MAIINGTDVKLYIPTEDVDNDDASTAWEPAALARSSSLNIDVQHPDASNKDSSGWGDSLSGQRSWSVTFEGLVDFTLTLANDRPNVRSFWTYVNSRSRIKIAFGQDGYHWYGDAGISNLGMNTENEQPGTSSLSLTGKGALAFTSDGSTDVDSSATYPQ